MDPAAATTALAASAGGAGQRDLVVLLLIGGVLALGLPHVTARDRRRVWHHWVNGGLLSLLAGMFIGPAMAGWLSAEAAERLRPLLAVALAAAGVLVGTQLRVAYLLRAGAPFLRRESGGALAQALAAGAPLALTLIATGTPLAQALGAGGLTGAAAVVTSQRPPLAAEGSALGRRALLVRHVAPAGWWNLCALALGSLALSLGFHLVGGGRAWRDDLLVLLLAPLLGLGLGRLTTHARDRDEVYLFLLAVLAGAAGLALALSAVPLLVGILVGAVFANVVLARAAIVEAALEDMEQPVAVGTGLLAGLCIAPVAAPPWVWPAMAMVAVSRWIVRRHVSPTGADLCPRRDRALAAPGAAGVLLVGSCVLAPPPADGFAVPLACALAALTLLNDAAERRAAMRATA